MIETTVAGSLPKPDWLAEPERLWPAWKLDGAALIEGQQKAATEWIKTQERSGIDIVSDGEQFRRHFVHGFLETIDGIDWNRMTTMGIRDNRYDAQVPTVTAKVRRTVRELRIAMFCVGARTLTELREVELRHVGPWPRRGENDPSH